MRARIVTVSLVLAACAQSPDPDDPFGTGANTGEAGGAQTEESGAVEATAETSGPGGESSGGTTTEAPTDSATSDGGETGQATARADTGETGGIETEDSGESGTSTAGSEATTVMDTLTSTSGSTTGGPVCGNDVVEGNEQCDGLDLDGETCESLDYGGGELACNGQCTFDTSDCCAGFQQACSNSMPCCGPHLECFNGTCLY